MGNHRAESRGRRAATSATPTAPSPGGRRKATRSDRPATQRGTAGKRLPGIPTLVGAAAILVAGAGAISLNHDHLGNAGDLHLSAGSSNGTDAIGFGPSSRTRAVSRDSDRQALATTTSKKLKAQAEAANVERNAALTSQAQSAEHRASQIAENRWILPTVGYHLTGRFGQISGLWATFHTGLDFAAPTGTPIFAIASGVITSTGWDGPYGNKTVETLSDGTQLWYAHQSFIGVQPGEKVTQGETIGRIGATGNTTGPHVHIEVRPDGGAPVDPYPQFIAHGVTP